MNCSRTKLTLPIEYASDKTKISDKQAIKASDKQAIKASDKQAIKASDKSKLILNIMEKDVKYKTNDIADAIDLSPARARVYLKELVDAGTLKSDGANKSKVYYL
jgi:Fic family protein